MRFHNAINIMAIFIHNNHIKRNNYIGITLKEYKCVLESIKFFCL